MTEPLVRRYVDAAGRTTDNFLIDQDTLIALVNVVTMGSEKPTSGNAYVQTRDVLQSRNRLRAAGIDVDKIIREVNSNRRKRRAEVRQYGRVLSTEEREAVSA